MRKSILILPLTAIAATTVLWATPAVALGDEILVANSASNTIRAYTTSGATVNACIPNCNAENWCRTKQYWILFVSAADA